MQRRVHGILMTASVVLAGVLGCGPPPVEGVRAGDTVKPILSGPVYWTAGQTGRLGARLVAQSPGDGRWRALNFLRGVSANPVATITFFKGEEQLGSPVETVLAHRC
jgi:hypothetical protein